MLFVAHINDNETTGLNKPLLRKKPLKKTMQLTKEDHLKISLNNINIYIKERCHIEYPFLNQRL